MKISANGISLIKEYEGLKLTSYLCPAGKWTIGIGSTIVNGKPVVKGMTCTEKQAYQYLDEHLESEVYPYINLVKVPLNQNQFDALCCFIYNLGGPTFKNSTLLRVLNEGQYDKASDQFLVWNKSRIEGKLVAVSGLTKRRHSERDLFIS